MNPTFQRLMQEVKRLTTSGPLRDATQAIQRALGGATAGATTVDTPRVDVRPDAPHAHAPCADALPPFADAMPSLAFESPATVVEGDAPRNRHPGRGQFVAGTHTLATLTRRYKLYVPPAPTDRPLPLVVMLHGCTQDPDDFAAGTGMNGLANEQGFCVLYPAQAQDANPSRCWNWFKHNHQGRERGEAALIATMTQAVMQQRGIDPARVYIAGLSAGGAMASLVAAAYPELFAAVGVHSGLAPGAAQSLVEGLAAMRSGAGGPGGMLARPLQGLAGSTIRPGLSSLPVPAIVFHGDQDPTVHPSNGEQVIAAVLDSGLRPAAALASPPAVEKGISLKGQRYTRMVYGVGVGAGPAVAEHWVVHGAGHAWSGGQAAGSYTNAQGPDASLAMLRFFFSQAAHAGH